MAAALTLVRALPVAFAGRCAVALAEIAIAAAILSGAVVVGHDLREWRAWYGDPATTHPWAPTAAPASGPVAEPRSRRPAIGLP